MEPAPLFLLLSLGLTCSGRLTVLPREPLVETGGSIQLNCSLDCPDGNVQWKGLDTNLGNIIFAPSYSVLLVSNATVAMEGRKICVGQCQRTPFQASVNLQVYSLPDTLQLETQPKELVAGQPARLSCSVSEVYPPGSLALRWYRGDQSLPSPDPEEVGDDEELFSYTSELEVPVEQVTEDTEFRCEAELSLPSQSFHRVRSVTVSTKAVSEQPTTESVTSQETPRTESPATTKNPPAPDWSPTTGLVGTTGNPLLEVTSPAKPTTELAVTSHDPSTRAPSVPWLASTETLGVETSTSAADWNPSGDWSSSPGSLTTDYIPRTESSLTKPTTHSQTPRTESPATTKNPPAPDWSPTTGPVGTTGNPLLEVTSPAKPITELAVTSHDPSTRAPSVPWLASTETLGVETSTSAADWNPSGDWSSSPGSLTTDYIPRTESSLTKPTTRSQTPRTELACNLLIRPVPPHGTIGAALKITCEADCSEDVPIKWVKTPVALSHYRKEVSERKSTLKVDHVGLSYQGIYQCVMLSGRPQMASLNITVSAAAFSTDPAIAVGTAGSFLGLIITAFASRRLWRRFHPLGGKSPQGYSV